jgi:hypothetical protein
MAPLGQIGWLKQLRHAATVDHPVFATRRAVKAGEFQP